MQLRTRHVTQFDVKQSIGKRYANGRGGTPWCFTVDQDTLSDGTVTARDRDTGDSTTHQHGRRTALPRRKDQRRWMRVFSADLGVSGLTPTHPQGKPPMSTRFVYRFGGDRAEGDVSMKPCLAKVPASQMSNLRPPGPSRLYHHHKACVHFFDI